MKYYRLNEVWSDKHHDEYSDHAALDDMERTADDWSKFISSQMSSHVDAKDNRDFSALSPKQLAAKDAREQPLADKEFEEKILPSLLKAVGVSNKLELFKRAAHEEQLLKKFKNWMVSVTGRNHYFIRSVLDLSHEFNTYLKRNISKMKESKMNFPMLQMLAEGRKKKTDMEDMDGDMNMDMEVDTSMEPAKKGKSAGDKKSAPKGMKDTPSAGDEMVVDKAAVLKFLKGATPEDRKSISTRLTKMVAADEAAAE